ncbi:MAG: Glycosyl hydrolase [Rahnella inusitata]|jgi:hypothetical protein
MMESVNGFFKISAILMTLTVIGCQAKQAPTQVIYRFDDHRFLELTGYDCEGALWYTDSQRGIHSQITSQFFRIFTKTYIHPSEQYIAIPNWDTGHGGVSVSKDYGQTWRPARPSPGPNEPDGMDSPPQEDVISFTVVNDQGFLLTKKSLYMSSKPFEDPRVQPGGPGIPHTLQDGQVQVIKPGSDGWKWGMVYSTKRGLVDTVQILKTNWQGLPDKVPEVNNYKGWDHMRCDMSAGKGK